MFGFLFLYEAFAFVCFLLSSEFLNYDEDEVAEADDDDAPNAEETRFIDNSGWSSRTR